MRFSIREAMVPGETLLERFRFCASVAIEGIELTGGVSPTTLEEVRAAARETGVQPVLCSSRSGGAALDARPEERARYLAGLREALELAAELKAVGVIMLATSEMKEEPTRPRVPDLQPWMSRHELERQLLYAQLRELGPYAARRGVAVILEPVNRYEQWWPVTIEAACEICGAVGEGVATMADFFHMQLEELDVARAIAGAGPLLRHVHVADNTRGLPGTGRLDFRTGLGALAQIGYSGFYGFEGRMPERDADIALARAMQGLRASMAEATDRRG